MKIKVIIPAGGEGLRLGGDVPKQFQLLGGQPILKRTIAAFDGLDCIAEIAVAVPAGYISHVQSYGFDKVGHIIEGGESRAKSVYAALKCLGHDTSVVLIHDGARPFVSPETIKAVADAACAFGAAIACAPVTDTIKEVDSTGRISATPNRSKLWRAQTPQGFTYDIITKAYAQGEKDDILDAATDDSILVERLGLPVYVVPAPAGNIKITTPEDMLIGEVLLKG